MHAVNSYTHTHTALARAQNCRRSFHTEWHLLVRAQKTIWQGRADRDSCQDTRLEVVQGLEASCTVYIGFFSFSSVPLSVSHRPLYLLPQPLVLRGRVISILTLQQFSGGLFLATVTRSNKALGGAAVWESTPPAQKPPAFWHC